MGIVSTAFPCASWSAAYVALAVLVPLRSPAAPAAERITFAVQEDTRLRKVFERELLLTMRAGNPKIDTGFGFDLRGRHRRLA